MSDQLLHPFADVTKLNLRDHGAQRFEGACHDVLAHLCATLDPLPRDQAGVRINGLSCLRPLVEASGQIGSIAANVLGPLTRPVRATLFDKSAAANWSLAWHQDRTICVRQKVEIDGFGPWTIKAGMQHVAPPFDLLSRMITLRIHVDSVPRTNAPLLIAPASHLDGRVPVGRIEEVVRRRGVAVCTAAAGDVWMYATPILHASEAAERPARRRVLQVDFAAEDLPGDLDWLGI